MNLFRLAVLGILLLLAVPVGAAYVAPDDQAPEIRERPDNLTVVTVDGTGPGQLVAYRPNGSVFHKDDFHSLYHDVDPSPTGRTSVMYVASDTDVPDTACNASSCIRNVVERVNLSTGVVRRLYTRVGPSNGSSQIHDVDRVNESVLLVGDIGPPDRVYMVNTTTNEIVWEWRVASAYSPRSGGRYPGDWTHLNDVAYLADGRVIVNLRNQDQVVSIRPGQGLVENWTLGCDDCHDMLYEQHNPDYIPERHGGPAVVVADSENNRIVEYQRQGGRWTRTWVWSDFALQWPRDADRLPDGDTLVVDSHGNRVMEVDQTSDITWQIEVPDGVYDAERIGTGDESTGGPSMASLATSRSQTATNPLTGVVPAIVLHGALYVLPDWVSPTGGAALLIGSTVVVLWLIVELGVRLRRMM